MQKNFWICILINNLNQIKKDLSSANESLESLQIELTDALEEINKVEKQIVEGETKLEETTNR